MLSDNSLSSVPLRPNRSREVPRDPESILLVRAECTHYLIVPLLVAGFLKIFQIPCLYYQLFFDSFSNLEGLSQAISRIVSSILTFCLIPIKNINKVERDLDSFLR